MTASTDLRPLRRFIREMTLLVERSGGDEAVMLEEGRTLLAELVGRDDWLPAEAAVPHPERYQQHLLHCDPLERFSLVSFVWGPGQMTPVHDHTVWGLVGMLRGAGKPVELAGHRAQPCHLPEQPGIDLRAQALFSRVELPGLAAEILQDRRAFEYANIAVDERRDLPIRIDRAESLGILLALQDVDDFNFVGQPHFLQCDGDLVTIERREIKQPDHALFPISRKRSS